MNIWIDIAHIPQFNFYHHFIPELIHRGDNVYVTVLKRGKLPKIVQYELQPLMQESLNDTNSTMGKLFIKAIGKHRMNKWSALIEANLLRIPQLFFFALGKHFDCAFANHHQVSIVGSILRIPRYAFGDDPQVRIYPMFVKFATQSHMLIYEATENCHILPKDKVLHCLKEWAYLNPRTFKPNVKVLEKYGVQPKQYLFLREVSVGTVNYAAQSPQAILSISPLIQQFTQWCQAPMCNFTQSCQTPLCNFKVLFSLEEKNRRSEYPADWILLQEPIEDIHSLMYYAAGLVSSGDSMAREAALLGIPAYYLGVRHSMPANLAASKVANLQNETTQPFEQWLREVIGKSEEVRTREQEEVRRKIDEEFIDINEYMLSLVEGREEVRGKNERRKNDGI